ncbi:hypothetical protein [Trinickia dinghuensis]|uniref:Uncharacterized protein n=1 Tax=Trinickia dinghuensis TaxID=2291023 RepID=A0A3D8K1F1_9BURK|nr:hypothetical protein [Trinickia dinghuensis]RDU98431.1 hypothetical protein DWV00_14120 [Trinickia dinghuensis]
MEFVIDVESVKKIGRSCAYWLARLHDDVQQGEAATLCRLFSVFEAADSSTDYPRPFDRATAVGAGARCARVQTVRYWPASPMPTGTPP